MDFSDTKKYIESQLKYSGHNAPIFTEDAMRSIFEFSGGNPRAINRACTQSLIYGSQMKQTCIDSKSVDIVLKNEVTGGEKFMTEELLHDAVLIWLLRRLDFSKARREVFEYFKMLSEQDDCKKNKPA
ncbi:hypothetical protein [Ruminococcus albus]|uniref:hypothetical protein n=1 Tax=Ruminococcus albus TaxID=1264 RepID=UPI000465934B|nr:hypothetical protein [Ruminococcus albus]